MRKELLRVLVRVDADWRVSVSCPTGAGALGEVRQLGAREAANLGGRFPWPAEGTELPDICVDQAGRPTVDRVAEVYSKIALRRLRPNDGADVVGFGRYLFATLIGSDWPRIQAVAKERGAGGLELALLWDACEGDLHRLNWELMHGPTRFLAEEAPRPVAVTRLVPSTARFSPEVLVPSRVLFLIGTSMTDPEIRPGAEFLCLLHQLEAAGIEHRLEPRILERASPRRIREAMAQFRPDVVFFMGHGNLDPQTGQPYLELSLDEGETDARLRRKSGTDLLRLLRVDDRLPPIVVLNACYSATSAIGAGVMLGAHETAPLAAELVAGGVSAVVGMAGRVSDLACRLFTRQFGEALVRGDSIVAATAEGRWAALTEGIGAGRSVDWAFPAVFLSEHALPTFGPTVSDKAHEGTRVESWVSDLRLRREPVFCGRLEFFEAYERLLSEKTNRPVLAVYVSETHHLKGYGRTRLLTEFAARAVRTGHLPLLVTNEEGANSEPRSALDLGVKIYEAIKRIYKAYHLGRPASSQLRLLQKFRDRPAELEKEPGVADWIVEEIEANEKITHEAVKLAIQEDLRDLVAKAREKHPFVSERRGRAVVLLDDVEQYDQALPALFNDENGMLGERGLGTSDDPVPVVLAFSLANPAAVEYLVPILEKKKPKVWLRIEPLGAFKEGEDLLAYERILLHEYRPSQLPYRIGPMARKADAPKDVVEFYEQQFRSWLRGIPRALSEVMLYAIAQGALKAGFLQDADDRHYIDDLHHRLGEGR